MVFNKNFVLSVFSKLSISIKWISSCILCVFTFGTCNFHHLGFHVRILVMRITVEVVPAPRCRAFTWIIVVSVNRVTRVVQARYLGLRVIPVSCERTSFQNRETRAHRDNSGTQDIPAPRDISPHVNRLLVIQNMVWKLS